jgi:enamine deaminase RidA (YjgF/YER057c/UK114 family)
MAVKKPVHNDTNPDYRAMFNWGVKISDLSELFLIAGHGAHDADGVIQHPNDAVGQTEYILNDLVRYLEQAGYSKNDIIRVEFTVTKDVDSSDYDGIFAHFVKFFEDVNVKPAAGTLRVVDSLAIPGMLVEYEFWAAK